MIFQLSFHLIDTSAIQCFCMNFDGKEKLSALRLVRTAFRNWPLVRAFHQVCRRHDLLNVKFIFREAIISRGGGNEEAS